MAKLKELFAKYKEIILYLIFGVLTTLVGWVVYFAIFWSWKLGFSIPADDTTSGLYLTGYTIAQVIQWIAAVLFAFFTNRKWVFTKADRDVPIMKQLIPFAGGRVFTFLVDYGVTLGGGILFSKWFPSLTAFPILGRELNVCDLLAKVIAAVIVIILNYIISKLLVFKEKKADQQ
ncbi:MAG: GtrA family protein [Clostridia bacterium]|nr:GtrA family protein [Clostridia bacterium]